MKDKWSDVNRILVGQLEKLSGSFDDDALSEAQLDLEIKRSEAMARVAEAILRGGELMLKASIASVEYGNSEFANPLMLEAKNSES